MEKKNDPKEAFRKITIEMTGEAEVLVVNPRLMMRTFEAAIACSVLHEDLTKECNNPGSVSLTREGRVEYIKTLSRFLSDLLLELGDGVDPGLLLTDTDLR